MLTKETAFHSRWSALTRNVTEYRGYWLPTCFTNEGAVSEYWACREKAAVMDLSPLRKWEILGPDAERLMQTAVTRDVRRLADGQVVYTAMCNETGGMVDDATVFRLGAGQLPLRRRRRVRRRAPRASSPSARTARVDQADDRRAAQPRRPGAARAATSCKEIVWSPPDPAAARGAALVPLPDRPDRATYDGIPVIVSRTGYSGELGYEVFCHPSDGEAVWDAIMDGRRAARPEAARPRRARHAADRVRADLRRLRVRRPGRPVRGRHRLHGRARHGGRLPRQGGADRAQGSTRSARSSGSSSRATRPRATATASTSPARARRSA